MKNTFSKISFDTLFKVILLVFIGYFLFLLTKISMQLKDNSDVGRYQFHTDNPYLLDTKTGVIKRYPRP